MLYITGDTHNTQDMENVSEWNMKFCCMEQGVDYSSITNLVILGDFGLPWKNCPVDDLGIHPRNKDDCMLLEWYRQKPFKILALMGNHDNYDMLEKLPQIEAFGGRVLKVSDNIFYLKRGEIYTIEDKRILVLGGALSEDKAYRVPNKSWWPQEVWSREEEKACVQKIKEEGTIFDYVFSHTGPSAGIALADCFYSNEENLLQLEKDSTVQFNNELDKIISYKKWFFGHWHSDWGYENYGESAYVPLFRQGIVL